MAVWRRFYNDFGTDIRATSRRWKDVPRGTRDEVSSFVRLDLPFVRR